MSLLVINPDTLSDIADAIRSKTGGVDTMTPLEMPDEIESITTGGSGDVVINWYSGYVSTGAAQERSYTAEHDGTLFVCAINTALNVVVTGWDRPRAYLNDVEQTALTSGGGTWDWRYNNGLYYATYSIDVVEGDEVRVTAIPATPSAVGGRVSIIFAVFV